MDVLIEYRLRLEHAYQRAVVARSDVEEMHELAATARTRLLEIERGLADAAANVGGPMQRLAARLELSARVVDFLWTAVACSVDGRIVPHIEAIGGTHARRGLSPSVYAILSGLGEGAIAELAYWLASPNRVTSYGLVSATDVASPAARAYLASSRLIGYLSGDEGSIAPLRRLAVTGDALRYDEFQLARVADVSALLAQPSAVVVIEGPPGSGRASAVATATGSRLIVLDLARLATGEVVDALVALRRETVLSDAVPVLANADRALSEEHPEQRRLLGNFIDELEGRLVVTVTVPRTDLGTERPLVRVPWRVAETDVREALWRREVEQAGREVGGDLHALAHRYRVGPAAIRRAVASATMRPAASIDAASLAAGLRHNISERLGGLAQRIEVTQSWNDLVIADDTSDQIAALVGRIRYAAQVLEGWGYRDKIARGTGVAALFSGPPGTGKTMVAGLVARELDLELYQVDLSKIVSKWVGETEKQLARVFDAAEEGHALLLFDEADALFGQRSTEVKGATDRYANLEVNYLLQRVEAFEGITILTTNLETAIDTALKRRLAAHIVFAAPDEEERARLWERQTITGTAPLASDVDREALAHGFPNMTGANIRNAAIAAAFLAAADGATEITQEHLVRAARAEYRSMGHMVSDAASVRQTRSRL